MTHAMRPWRLHEHRLVTLGALAAEVLHDVANPVTSILANVEVAARRVRSLREAGCDVDDELGELQEILHDNVRVAQALRHRLRSLGGFARASARAAKLSVHAEVEDACLIASSRIAKRARFERSIAPVPPMVAFPGELCHLTVNLLLNAAESIEPGAAERHRVGLELSARDGELLLAVEDSGCGVDASVRGRMFDPFFTTKPRGEGTGLGLAIAADIAARHGGRIEIAPRRAGGSRFEVVMPLRSTLRVGAPRDADQSEPPGGGRSTRQ